MKLAGALGITGTPGYVVGNKVVMAQSAWTTSRTRSTARWTAAN